MERVHDAIAWYQKKIGSYDKQLWEQSVESKIIKSLKHVPKRSVRVKTELIDVDLVRGSTFSKAKPEVSWTFITRKAITRIILFPICSRWWIQQTSVKFWLLMLILYCLQLTAVLIFFRNVEDKLTQNELILSEAIIPLALMFMLGLVHSQTVLSHFSHRGHRDKSGRDSKGRRLYRRSLSMPVCPVNSDVSSPPDVDGGSPDKKAQSNTVKEEGRQTKDTLLDGKNRVRKKKPLGQGKSVSWSDVYARQGPKGRVRSSVDSDDSDESLRKITPLMNGIPKKVDLIRRQDDLNMKKSQLNNHRSSGSFESDIFTEEDELHKDEQKTPKPGFLAENAKSAQETCEKFEILSMDVNVSEVAEKQTDLKLPTGEGKIILPQNGKILLSENVVLDTIEKGSKEMGEGGADNSAVCENGFHREDSGSLSSTQSSGIDTCLLRASDSYEGLSSDGAGRRVGAITENYPHLQKEEEEKEICQKKKESDTDTDRDESDTEVKTFQGLRRRKPRQDDIGELGASYGRSRRTAQNLSRNEKDRSSSEIEDIENVESLKTEEDNRATISSEEWEDRVQSDVSTSSYSSTSESEAPMMDSEATPITEDTPTNPTPSSSSQGERNADASPNVINLLQPQRYRSLSSSSLPSSTSGIGHGPPPDKVSCVIWEASECKKVELTALDIGWMIIEKVDNIPESSDYILIGIMFSLILGLVPILFRVYHCKDLDVDNLNITVPFLNLFVANTWRENFILINGIVQRLCLSAVFFFLLSVADRTFKQRLLYAKHFCYLTSSRRAKKFDMPHFRLNKVRNIKIWLSLRSYLKKRGPQRSVDVIVSAAFLFSIIILTLMCLQLLKDTEKFLDYLCNWELMVWCLALGMYLMHFMTLGLKINKKYRNLSVLITEQINLYLQMEQKPHKKEELMVANNVLKLAEDLLKELESPFKISGVSANPVIYNIIKVVVLSAFSAVLTELLGFKLKLYKIKLKA